MSKKPEILKFDPKVGDEIANLIRMGNFVEVAAKCVGISKGAFYQWLKKGRRDRRAGVKSVYSEFADKIEKAGALAEGRFVSIIAKAAEEQWTAAAWWLERTKPQRWGKKDKLEHSGQAQNLHIELKGVSLKDL